jgi:uncharacterized protein with NRDE domain
MCLIFISVNQHPVYKLIIAANRDEFYDRETAPASYWPDDPFILGGRDLKAKGTWLGMTTGGKISLLTNYRDPSNINPMAPSRGRLVSDFLRNDFDAQSYLADVQSEGKRYNGFNLLAGTVDELFYYSNYADGLKHLTSGIYGLSNHLIDTPWPKVVRGKSMFQTVIGQPSFDPESLFEFLYDDQTAPDDQLPDTGIGLERERALSSMFIKTPHYGSRSSTVVLVDHANRVLFTERVYDLKSFEYSLGLFEFTISQ